MTSIKTLTKDSDQRQFPLIMMVVREHNRQFPDCTKRHSLICIWNGFTNNRAYSSSGVKNENFLTFSCHELRIFSTKVTLSTVNTNTHFNDIVALLVSF